MNLNFENETRQQKCISIRVGKKEKIEQTVIATYRIFECRSTHAVNSLRMVFWCMNGSHFYTSYKKTRLHIFFFNNKNRFSCCLCG